MIKYAWIQHNEQTSCCVHTDAVTEPILYIFYLTSNQYLICFVRLHEQQIRFHSETQKGGWAIKFCRRTIFDQRFSTLGSLINNDSSRLLNLIIVFIELVIGLNLAEFQIFSRYITPPVLNTIVHFS